ncbi:MAG: Txe/YoeB family addiction module toxin [Paludibacteraceae bacterium]|nr:Txe/YoeB family addiction module toxin [Paludibacteraceae bacterium]
MELTKYELRLSDEALEHIGYFKKLGDAAIKRKIDRLLQELEEHPANGSGQPEQLRYELTGFWSRRINLEHRILYQIDETAKVVYIFKMKGHY